MSQNDALVNLANILISHHMREWRQGAHNNLGCTACGFQWDTPKDERHSDYCIVGLARAALQNSGGSSPSAEAK